MRARWGCRTADTRLLALGALAAALAGSATATAAPAGVHFAVKGDWGAGTNAQAAVTRRMCAVNRRAPFAFVLTTGDNFYSPDGVATPGNFSTPEACLLRAGVRWRAAWGNHDLGGDGTATALASPARRYRFAQEPLLVVVLDGNNPADPAQRRFLENSLRASRRPVRIVVFHQPAFTAGLHAPGEQQQLRWVPLLRRYRVSLVLQGHNHAYERIVRDGVTYITTGGGGADLYPCVRPTRGLRRCVMTHHFLDVVAVPGGLRVRAIAADGTTIERLRLPARPVTS